ncbi:hypothetical protein V8C42DRAFT_40002 [Trichoderma barbatum]
MGMGCEMQQQMQCYCDNLNAQPTKLGNEREAIALSTQTNTIVIVKPQHQPGMGRGVASKSKHLCSLPLSCLFLASFFFFFLPLVFLALSLHHWPLSCSLPFLAFFVFLPSLFRLLASFSLSARPPSSDGHRTVAFVQGSSIVCHNLRRSGYAAPLSPQKRAMPCHSISGNSLESPAGLACCESITGKEYGRLE